MGALNIMDSDAFERMTELEGTAWAEREREHQAEPNTFFDALEGFRIMIGEGLIGKMVEDPRTGAQRELLIGDVIGSNGFLGFKGEIYVVNGKGEIGLLMDTATMDKRIRAMPFVELIKSKVTERPTDVTALTPEMVKVGLIVFSDHTHSTRPEASGTRPYRIVKATPKQVTISSVHEEKKPVIYRWDGDYYARRLTSREKRRGYGYRTTRPIHHLVADRSLREGVETPQ